MLLGRGERAARLAVNARNTLKSAFRLGMFRNYRAYTYENRLATYGTIDEVLRAASHTSSDFNIVGAWLVGGAVANGDR